MNNRKIKIVAIIFSFITIISFILGTLGLISFINANKPKPLGWQYEIAINIDSYSYKDLGNNSYEFSITGFVKNLGGDIETVGAEFAVMYDNKFLDGSLSPSATTVLAFSLNDINKNSKKQFSDNRTFTFQDNMVNFKLDKIFIPYLKISVTRFAN